MPTIRRVPVGKTRIELGEDDPFISLEEMRLSCWLMSAQHFHDFWKTLMTQLALD